ncbi:MAG: hypothetical protein ACXWTN_07665 [Methylosarcina sp.]
MVHNPKIPMRPEDVPQQRLYSAVELPPRPESFHGVIDWMERMPDKVRPKGSPRKTTYLGSVEWASSARETRFDSYYLNPRGSYWLLWNRWQDDNDWKMVWRWTLYAYGKKKGVAAKTAALYLLLDAWKKEKEKSDLEHYFLIDEPGFLSIAEISEIGRQVWPPKS